MSRGSWAASGRPPARAGRDPRPPGSWSASVDRAREAWDDLTGGPERCLCSVVIEGGHRPDCRADRYSDAAAAAILSTALGLWADTAATLGGETGTDAG